MLAQAVEKILGERGWSIRRAATYTGLDPNQIVRLKSGLSIETEPLIRFAKMVAGEESPVRVARRFLSIAGKDEVVSLLDAAQREAREPSSAPGGYAVAENIAPFGDAMLHRPDDFEVHLPGGHAVTISGMAWADDGDRDLVTALIRRLVKDA